jgi:c-di-GMP-binding flagellar brake protein YcgR
LIFSWDLIDFKEAKEFSMSPPKILPGGTKQKNDDQSQSDKGTVVVERRRHPRINVELPLNYSIVEAKESHGGMIADASEGGLLVYLTERIPIGTHLKIEILFVKGLELTSIKGITKVVWLDLAARESFGEFRYGLQFQSFHEGDLDRLKTLLNEIGRT